MERGGEGGCSESAYVLDCPERAVRLDDGLPVHLGRWRRGVGRGMHKEVEVVEVKGGEST
jgi:hypothetical protein